MNGSKRKGFTLIEIMIVITIISILLGIAIPNFLNSREKTKSRTCIENLHMLNTAKEQFAMANGIAEGGTITPGNLLPYLHEERYPECPTGGVYNIGTVGETPSCSIVSGNYPHVFVPTN